MFGAQIIYKTDMYLIMKYFDVFFARLMCKNIANDIKVTHKELYFYFFRGIMIMFNIMAGIS